jgi:hypothetical protein
MWELDSGGPIFAEDVIVDALHDFVTQAERQQITLSKNDIINVLQLFSDLQQQLDALNTGLNWKGSSPTRGELETLYPSPENNWTIIVDVDETHEFIKTFYKYDETIADWIYLGPFSVNDATSSTKGAIRLGGDFEGNAMFPILKLIGVTPGRYLLATPTIDAKGRTIAIESALDDITPSIEKVFSSSKTMELINNLGGGTGGGGVAQLTEVIENVSLMQGQARLFSFPIQSSKYMIHTLYAKSSISDNIEVSIFDKSVDGFEAYKSKQGNHIYDMPNLPIMEKEDKQEIHILVKNYANSIISVDLRIQVTNLS